MSQSIRLIQIFKRSLIQTFFKGKEEEGIASTEECTEPCTGNFENLPVVHS